MAQYMFSTRQRVFIYDSYVLTRSAREVQKLFEKTFPGVKIPGRTTIHNLVNKFQTTGSVQSKKPNRQRRVLTEEKLDDISKRLENTPIKSLRHLSQQTGISYGSVQRAAKLLKLKRQGSVSAQMKLQLKQQRDKIKQYQKRIEQTLQKDRELAKKLLQDGKKERAKLLLRKKRFQEQLLQRTDGQLENLERLVHDLEFSQIEMQVVDGLKVGNEALKKIHEVLNVDEIERILDETREGIEKQNEIDELLSGALTSEDEDAVEAELEKILLAEMPEVPEVEPAAGEPVLPDVPAEPVPQSSRERPRKEKVALEAA